MKTTTKANMSKNLVTVRWDDSMQTAAETMENHRIRHLPVVDELGVVVGILSARDIHRAMSPVKEGFLPDAQAAKYMTWPVITVPEWMPIRSVAEGMIDEKVSCFVVTDDKSHPTGIITSEDLLRVLVNMLTSDGLTERLRHSPVIGELLREAQSAGL